MNLLDIVKNHTASVEFCGTCECGGNKYDLITDDGLVYPPIHEESIRHIKPELLEEIKKNAEGEEE